MLDKEIANFSYSCMSDAKWRKLFGVINDSNLKFANCVWKLVGESEPKNGFVPDLEQLGENYVGDCGALNGPFEFKRMEWIKLPTSIRYKPYDKAPTKVLTQDLSILLIQLNAIGNFELDENSEGITIYGYKP